jgi:PhzF family phenazine biosynthesis protein
MTGVRVRLVDAFTDAPFCGNPAVVVALDEAAPTEWMAALARELTVPDTAFVVPSTSAEADFGLRWFTPAAEVDLCGHATLATAHCLLEDGAADPIRFTTRSGILIVTRRADGSLAMDFPASPPTAADTGTRSALADALGTRVDWAARTNDDVFLLAQLADERAVRQLTPNLEAIAALDGSAVIVTAIADEGHDYDFVSRLFAPSLGIPEDPVTGSSHTVLAPFWAERLARATLRGFQASHRPGRLALELRGDRVVVGGRAVTVLDGALAGAAAPTALVGATSRENTAERS